MLSLAKPGLGASEGAAVSSPECCQGFWSSALSCCCTEPSWHCSKCWGAVPAFLSSWAGRGEHGEGCLLAYSLLVIGLVSGWKVVVTAWKEEGPWAPVQVSDLFSTEQFFLYEGRAWDGPKADMELETSLRGHFSSVMHCLVIFFSLCLFAPFPRNSAEVIAAGILNRCFFQQLNRAGNGKENMKGIFCRWEMGRQL